jgi:hypothetical protein
MVIIDGDGIGTVKAVTRAIVQLRPLFDPIGIVFYRGSVTSTAAEDEAGNICACSIV